MAGILSIVATPIGNLEDLSPRARAALERADLVACEDTRRTGGLLHRLGIKAKLVSLHDHNERQRVPSLIAALESGQDVAVASDAGTPLLSDPGFVLVREAAAHGIEIQAVPGPSAILAALVGSALPPWPFTFVGFPPRKGGARRRFYRRFASLDHTLVVFESPHRLLPSLRDALEEFGDRPVSIGRELTKLHEETLRGSLGQVIEELGSRSSLKGEFVVVIGGFAETPREATD